MMNGEDRVGRLEKIIASEIKSNPHSKDIIAAFRPLILERARLVDTVELKTIDALSLDKSLFGKGAPIIRQNALFREDDPFEAIVLSLITALKEGFPHLKGTWEKFEDRIKDKTILLNEYFKIFPMGEEIADRWASELGADSETAGLLLTSAVRVILEKRGRECAGLIKDVAWDHGYCPVCGTYPDITKNQEGTGQRWLHCPMCNHEWKFSRVICPSCGNTEQKEMSYFSVEGKDTESAFSCEKCKKYLITASKVSDMAEFDPDISVLSLVHLDVVMQEKGYSPVSERGRNMA